MSDFGFIVMAVAWSAIVGGFCWWLFWRFAKLESVATSNLWRRVFKGVGLFIGIGLPAMMLLVTVLHFYA